MGIIIAVCDDEFSAFLEIGECPSYLLQRGCRTGKASGIEVPLVELLADMDNFPCTYAGGVGSFEDLARLKQAGRGKVDVTIGSALDLFGGKMPYREVLEYIKKAAD